MKLNIKYTWSLTKEDKVLEDYQQKELESFIINSMDDDKEFKADFPKLWIDFDRSNKIQSFIDLYMQSKFLINFLNKISNIELENKKYKFNIKHNDYEVSTIDDYNNIFLSFYTLAYAILKNNNNNTDIEDIQFWIQDL